MSIKIKVHAQGLLNYASAGNDAVKRIKVAARKALNVGRKEARQRIAADFGVRTGLLRRKARSMQTKLTLNAAEIKGRVHPLPRLLNIFEGGATLAHGRGRLRARHVVAPAQAAMDGVAFKAFDEVMHGIGK